MPKIGNINILGIDSPLEIPDCALWLDASDATKINTGSPIDGDTVSLWTDKSGNSNNATGTLTDGIQTIDITGASEGQYEINSAVDVTGPIAWNATALTVQAALESLSDIGAGNVTVTLLGQVYTATILSGVQPIVAMFPTQDTLNVTPIITVTQIGYGITSRPIYKTAIQNGLSVIRFDITPIQYLKLLGTSLNLFRNISTFTLACTFMIVGVDDYLFQVSDGLTMGTRRFSLEPNNGPPYNIQIYFSNVDGSENANSVGLYSGYSSVQSILVASNLISKYIVAGTSEFPIQPPTSNVFGNSANPFPDTASKAIIIGAYSDISGGTVGDIAELIFYQRVLNMRERRLLLEYLSVKWGTL